MPRGGGDSRVWNGPSDQAFTAFWSASGEVGDLVDNAVERSLQRLERVDRALDAQRAYIQRVPDPDNRYRAETNLMTLLELREAAALAHSRLMQMRYSGDSGPR